MSNGFEYNSACNQSRWLGYFDLLGTRELIRSDSPFRVFSVYEKAVREATGLKSKLPQIRCAWFSDTFLIYSDNDSASDFGAIDMISRWFVYFLLQAEIPVRGAIACGSFYADISNQVYFGKALVEAYEYGEAQDWIGFLLCPSAIARLDEVGLPADKRLNYAYYNIPWKREMSPKRLPACILGDWSKINDMNQVVIKLNEMRVRQLEGLIVRKYENAIVFIEQNQRRVSRGVQPPSA